MNGSILCTAKVSSNLAAPWLVCARVCLCVSLCVYPPSAQPKVSHYLSHWCDVYRHSVLGALSCESALPVCM